MNTRSATGGKVSTVKAEICYHVSGKMITHFTYPNEQYILNNAKGEISLYDPAKNTVLQKVNYLYSSETTQFYFFLNNQKADLGLKAMGFINKNTKFDKNIMITNWASPPRLANAVKEVMLVHNGANPIYTKYTAPNGSIIKKIYYYNFKNLEGTDFPQAVTQIEYLSEKDSVITKTTYDGIKINDLATSPLFDFKIPANAKVIH